jgi:hypothetical protein
MATNLVIDRTLIAPPSETYAFRSLGIITRSLDCIVLVELIWEERDFYYGWIKQNKFTDFVKDIVEIGQVPGIRIHPFPIKEKLVLENLNSCINYVENWAKKC